MTLKLDGKIYCCGGGDGGDGGGDGDDGGGDGDDGGGDYNGEGDIGILVCVITMVMCYPRY